MFSWLLCSMSHMDSLLSSLYLTVQQHLTQLIFFRYFPYFVHAIFQSSSLLSVTPKYFYLSHLSRLYLQILYYLMIQPLLCSLPLSVLVFFQWSHSLRLNYQVYSYKFKIPNLYFHFKPVCYRLGSQIGYLKFNIQKWNIFSIRKQYHRLCSFISHTLRDHSRLSFSYPLYKSPVNSTSEVNLKTIYYLHVHCFPFSNHDLYP